jgi:hypothetical protein
MKVYSCWITCLLESYQDNIVAALIKRGYTVGLSGKENVNQSNQVSALISINLFRIDERDHNINKVITDVTDVLNEIKGYFYSIIVSESNYSTWAGSNIVVHNNKVLPQLPPADKNSKLN